MNCWGTKSQNLQCTVKAWLLLLRFQPVFVLVIWLRLIHNRSPAVHGFTAVRTAKGVNRVWRMWGNYRFRGNCVRFVLAFHWLLALDRTRSTWLTRITCFLSNLSLQGESEASGSFKPARYAWPGAHRSSEYIVVSEFEKVWFSELFILLASKAVNMKRSQLEKHNL